MIHFFEGSFVAHDDICDDLRKAGPTPGNPGKRSVLRAHNAKNLQGCHKPIPSGAVVAKNHVTALLATEIEIVSQHLVYDVFVSDGCADHAPSGRYQSRVQPRITHHSGHDGLLVKSALFEHVQTGDGHDVIPIHEL